MTLKEIAQELGLSVNTVSDVLNGGDTRYSKATRQRITETAARLGYRANRQAQVLAGGKSGIIGIIKSVTFHQSGVERTLFAGQAIHDSGYELLSYDALWHHDGLTRAVDIMLDSRVEGILMDGQQAVDPMEKTFSRLLKAKIPLVCMSGAKLPGIPYVAADFYHGSRLLTDHLLGLGHRRLAMMVPGGSPSPSTAYYSISRRIEGFRDAATEAGLAKECVELIPVPQCEESDLVAARYYGPGRQAMLEILKRKKRPDAVVCSNDLFALGALSACSDLGIEVPGEIALASFDNTSSGRYLRPSLTSVAQPVNEIAKTSVELLLRRIRGEILPEAETLLELPCQLAIRESCGAAAPLRREAQQGELLSNL